MTQTVESITERLLAFINSEIAVSPDPIASETDLLITGAVDSLGVVRVTQWLEDELGFEVDPVEVTLENFQTVSKMVAYANSKLS
ncbi:MAG: acyl carrier protein [Acidimicrobiales bacterium]